MELRLLPIFAFLSLALVVSHAALPSAFYWNSVLPNTPMPKAIKDLLRPDLTEDKGTPVVVGKGGVGVHTGKPVKRTNVVVGKGGVGVHTGKPGKRTNFGIRKDLFLHYGNAATENQIHDDPNVALFFLEKDLHAGNQMKLHFTESTNAATFLPRQVADSIPFSSNTLPEIFNKFSVKPESEEAEIMKDTIKTCEEPGNEGEDKYCATSLESMIDFSISKLGKNVQAIVGNIKPIKSWA